MQTDYTGRKNEVLACYERFEEIIIDLTTVIIASGLPDPTESIKNSLEDIRRKADGIKADRFRLMVAGESKSGKSTFINAYLGVELLPMAVLQCTSSIIEIKYGEKFRIVATYADGRTKTIDNESSAHDFLVKNAAIDDDYRDIPVPTINHEILVRAGLQAKEKGRQIEIRKTDIENLLAAKEIKAANIHNIHNYDEKIRRYIDEKKNKWQSIVVKVEIFFPFDEGLKGIEIIDSPGVCARGGVSEITANFIKKADAIIFLKPISGQALESVQFNEFMRNTSVERNHNALFLVFTRSTDVPPADLRRLEQEIYKQFNKLNKQNIIIVDSKAELYANKFATEQNIENRIRALNADGTIDDFVKSAWFDADGVRTGFLEVLRKKSRFEKIDEVLSTFGRKAHYLAFSALLEVISKYIHVYWVT